MALTLSGLPQFRILEKSSRDCLSTQERLLRNIIDYSKNTAFGKDHSFGSIKNIDDFRNAVPVRDFEGHRSYIERMCKGEKDVLFPGKPIFYNRL